MSDQPMPGALPGESGDLVRRRDLVASCRHVPAGGHTRTRAHSGSAHTVGGSRVMPPGGKLPGFVTTLKTDTAQQFQAPRHPGQGDRVMPDPGPRSAAPGSPWLLPPAASVPWSCWEIHEGGHASAALRKSPLSVTPPPRQLPSCVCCPRCSWCRLQSPLLSSSGRLASSPL